MSVVIDASALLALLLDEPGASGVVPHLRGSTMSAINVSECCSRAPDRGSIIHAVVRAIRRFEIGVVPFDMDAALGAAALRPTTRHIGASLGDRACIDLAQKMRVPLLTADRRLAELDIDIDIRLIR